MVGTAPNDSREQTQRSSTIALTSRWHYVTPLATVGLERAHCYLTFTAKHRGKPFTPSVVLTSVSRPEMD
jgi:hypothetical protein